MEVELHRLTVRLSPGLVKKLKVTAAQSGTSLQALVESLLTVGLKHWAPK